MRKHNPLVSSAFCSSCGKSFEKDTLNFPFLDPRIPKFLEELGRMSTAVPHPRVWRRFLPFRLLCQECFSKRYAVYEDEPILISTDVLLKNAADSEKRRCSVCHRIYPLTRDYFAWREATACSYGALCRGCNNERSYAGHHNMSTLINIGGLENAKKLDTFKKLRDLQPWNVDVRFEPDPSKVLFQPKPRRRLSCNAGELI